MINLLPPDVKQGYVYASRNVLLRSWAIAFGLGFIGLGMIATFGMLTLHQSTQHYKSQISANEALFVKENFNASQVQVKDITNNFRLVTQVLGKEILFSQLLKQIAATIPSNANLTGLTINQTQGGLDITAIATNYSTASQVQVNLSDPANKIFSKADIVSITCSSTSALDPRYPCTVTIRALFAKNNPFLFINSKPS